MLNSVLAQKLICVTGPDGAGKSSVIQQSIEWFQKEKGLRAREVSFWDAPRLHSRDFPIQPKQINDYLKTLSSPARTYFLLHCMMESLSLGLTSDADFLIVNSYWYKYLASEVAMGVSEANAKTAAAIFPNVKKTIYLTVPVEVAADRKQGKFTAYELGLSDESSREQFVRFQKLPHAILDRWAKENSWATIDGTLPIAEVVARTCKEISISL